MQTEIQLKKNPFISNRWSTNYASDHDKKINDIDSIDNNLINVQKPMEMDNLNYQQILMERKKAKDREIIGGNFGVKTKLLNNETVKISFQKHHFGYVFWISCQDMRFPLNINIGGQEKFTSYCYVSAKDDNPRKKDCDFAFNQNNFDIYYPEETYTKIYLTIWPIIPFNATITPKFYGKIAKLPPIDSKSYKYTVHTDHKEDRMFKINYDDVLSFTKIFMENESHLNNSMVSAECDEPYESFDEEDEDDDKLRKERDKRIESKLEEIHKRKKEVTERAKLVARHYSYFKNEMKIANKQHNQELRKKNKTKRELIEKMHDDRIAQYGKNH